MSTHWTLDRLASNSRMTVGIATDSSDVSSETISALSVIESSTTQRRPSMPTATAPRTIAGAVDAGFGHRGPRLVTHPRVPAHSGDDRTVAGRGAQREGRLVACPSRRPSAGRRVGQAFFSTSG